MGREKVFVAALEHKKVLIVKARIAVKVHLAVPRAKEAAETRSTVARKLAIKYDGQVLGRDERAREGALDKLFGVEVDSRLYVAALIFVFEAAVDQDDASDVRRECSAEEICELRKDVVRSRIFFLLP